MLLERMPGIKPVDRATLASMNIMSDDEQTQRYFQLIQQQIAALQQVPECIPLEGITASLDNLQLLYAQMQTKLEAAEIVEEGLLQQNQRIAAAYQHYYELFQASPIAYLVTDASGVILEANEAIAQLLNVPQRYLAGKPLIVFVAPSDHLAFYTRLNGLSQAGEVQRWQMHLCPRQGEPFVAELNLGIVRHPSGSIKALRIGVHTMSHYPQPQAQPVPQATPFESTVPEPALPHSLDGLRVLVVDDEADAREFITAVLESRGIQVTAVPSAAAALAALEQFHPDVLVSDIRMPDQDGYNLIRKVRELEAQQGWHIAAAAITAYLEEDREKALTAGFEAHLHKLAPPSELLEMVAQLAGRT